MRPLSWIQARVVHRASPIVDREPLTQQWLDCDPNLKGFILLWIPGLNMKACSLVPLCVVMRVACVWAMYVSA